MRLAIVVTIVTAILAATNAGAADVQVTVSTAAFVAAGSPTSASLRVENAGVPLAEGVILTIAIPEGLTFQDIIHSLFDPTAPECSASGQTVTCTIGQLGAVDYILSLAVDPTLREGTALTLQANATSTTADPNPANNNATGTFIITAGPADVRVTKTLESATRLPSGRYEVRYSLTATNLGPDTARFVRLIDDPQGVMGPPPLACIDSVLEANILTCRADALAPGASFGATFTATTSAPSSQFLRNTASVTSTSDPDSSNDTATVVGLAGTDIPLSGASLIVLTIALAVVAMAMIRGS